MAKSNEYRSAVFAAYNKARQAYMREHKDSQPKSTKSGMPLAPKKGTSGHKAIMSAVVQLLGEPHRAKFKAAHNL